MRLALDPRGATNPSPAGPCFLVLEGDLPEAPVTAADEDVKKAGRP
jgi:hypothetical protein